MELTSVDLLRENKPAVSESHQDYHDFFDNKYNNIKLWKKGDMHDSVESEALKNFNGIYCSYPLNAVEGIDEHLLSLHETLDANGFLLVTFESQAKRRSRLIKTIPLKLGKLYYYTVDFFVHRILARLNSTQRIYFKLTRGKNQVLSTPEVLGRLIATGFEIVDYTSAKADSYVLVANSNVPAINRKRSHGPLISLSRIGYKGKKINVFKFRTMRPYSEHLQKYLQDNHGTIDGDKIINDFRVTGWGKILRQYWIDELPMFLNLIKGDIKLIGVRPLSHHKFYSYPEYLQKKRIKVKPGLLPPYYADMPKSPEEFHRSEAAYTDAYLKSPLKTDLRYFFKILGNIVFRGARSK